MWRSHASIKGEKRNLHLTKILGSLSASALGFIVGDLPGAYFGYQAYNNLFQRKKVDMKRKSKSQIGGPRKIRKGVTTRYIKRRAAPKLRRYSRKKRRFVRSKKSFTDRFVANDLHSGLTSKYVRVPISAPIRGVVRKAGYTRYLEQYSARFQGIAGAQTTADFVQIGTVNQWLVAHAVGTVLSAAPNYSLNAYMDLNPMRGVTGSGVFTSAPNNAKPAMDRFALVNTEVTLDFTNFATTAASIDVYVFKAVKNVQTSPSGIWANAGYVESLGLAAAANNAPGAATGATIGYITNSVVGVKPHMFPELAKFWKVIKTKHIDLGGASSEKLTLDLGMNLLGAVDNFIEMNRGVGGSAMTIDPATWTDANILMSYPKGSVVVVIAAHGQVVADYTVPAAPLPTFSNTDIGIVVTKMHKFKPVFGSHKYHVAEGVLQIPASVALANERQINIVDGALAPQNL